MNPNTELSRQSDLARRRLFLDGGYADAIEQLATALQGRRGLTVVSGATGVGKTTLLQLVAERVRDDFVWCQPAGAPRTASQIYRALLPSGTETQVPDEGPVPPAVREALEVWLRQRAMKGTWTVLAIDDADDLPEDVLSLLDGLAGLEPMLQIVLVTGDNGSAARSADGPLGNLAPRIRERLRLNPLAREDWQSLASWWSETTPGSPPFDPEAVDVLGSLTGARPGRMIEVADRAAQLSKEQWLKSISKECVQLAATGGDSSGAATRPERRSVPRVVATPSAAPAIAEAGPGQPRGASMPSQPTSTSPAPVADVDVAAGSNPAPSGGWLSKGKLDPFRESPTALTIDSAELLPVLSDPHGIHAEWFRVLQVRVESWIRAHGGGPKAIVVTGPSANAGKTTVAANLALLWAHSSYQRVLLVDGDLRRPQFHAVFEIPRRPGFADLLAGRCTVEDCAAYVSEVGLNVIPAGRPGNPRQLVEPDRVSRAFDAARAAYDVVIVDSPPLSAMVDSRSMAGAADGVMVVLRAGQTRLQAVQRMLDYLPSDNLIGAVVNGAERDGDAAYAEYRRSTRGA